MRRWSPKSNIPRVSYLRTFNCILFSYNSKHGLAVFDHDLIEVIFPISSRTDLSTSPIPAFTSICECGGVRHVNISTLQGCTSGNCYQQTVPCAQVRRLTRLRLGLPFRERIPRSRSRLSPGRNTHLSLYNQSQRECISEAPRTLQLVARPKP